MKLHHLEVLCRSLSDQLNTFCHKLGFRPFAIDYKGFEKYISAIAIQRGTLQLVLREDRLVKTDTVHDVAIELFDVSHMCDVILKNGGTILKHHTTDDNATITSAVVKSPIGNVKHSLIQKNNYTGCFLPGFMPVDSYLESLESRDRRNGHSNGDCNLDNKLKDLLINSNSRHCDEREDSIYLDHVAFAVEPGSSFRYLNWYNKCFGFERFTMNDKERKEGFIVQAESKGKQLLMRLVATEMSYHLCSEVGCESNSDSGEENLKFVFGESFPDQGPNQIQTFINEHGGEGLQHIALNTDEIIQRTLELKCNGIDFIIPPRYYYDEMATQLPGVRYFDRQACEKLGILIDVERRSATAEEGYLLQVFTKPLFSRKTFFVELIERHQSVGFGAGNISALWRAFDKYFEEQGLQ